MQRTGRQLASHWATPTRAVGANVHRRSGELGRAMCPIIAANLQRHAPRVKHNISTQSTIPEYPLSTLSINRELFRTGCIYIDSATDLASGPQLSRGPAPCGYQNGRQPFYHRGRAPQATGGRHSLLQSMGQGRDIANWEMSQPAQMFPGDSIPSAVLCWRATQGPGCSAYVAGMAGRLRTVRPARFKVSTPQPQAHG